MLRHCMKRLIIHGDPGLSRGDCIAIDGTEYELFSITVNGEWHGPSKPQLTCIIGSADERDAFEERDFTPHFLETERIDAAAIDVRG